ncbi:hypothetical protein BASA83_001800 [Batrachochytrium salamandrivorans]|nr:hypothetical protein BASA83_001800 [Batrachochytrium salamandrivorans]
MERENRVKRGLCLVCGETGHRKVNCPKSRFKFKSDSSKNIHAIQTESMKQQNPREPIRLSSKKQLSSARQFSNFDTLDMDMMKTVDCKVHECDESDDVARGVLGRLENMVLAPRGETGSFTQMPSITHLYPHQPAKSSVSHTNVPPQSSVSDPCFWISSLSSLNKLLLPGTLHFGSAIHADTFFIDCGADDVFMDAELATRLNIPLVKIPVPIKLRLADGDSSSMITHRTLPLQLHIGRHVETIGFYVTSLCHGIILGYSWLERHNPQVNWESRMVDFGSNYCLENCCVGSTRIQGLGKPPRTSDISPKISIPEQESSGQTSDSAVDSAIDLSLFKDPSMDLDLGVKKPVLRVSKGTSKSVSFAETIQTEVYPFLEVSPVSKTPIPPEINEEFSSVFSESQANILPLHRSFDCTINLSSSAEPPYRKNISAYPRRG